MICQQGLLHHTRFFGRVSKHVVAAEQHVLYSVVYAVSKVLWDPHISGITRTPRPLCMHRAEFLHTSPHYTANLNCNETNTNKQRSKYIWRAGIQYLHDVVRAHLDVHLDAIARPDVGGEAKATCHVDMITLWPAVSLQLAI